MSSALMAGGPSFLILVPHPSRLRARGWVHGSGKVQYRGLTLSAEGAEKGGAPAPEPFAQFELTSTFVVLTAKGNAVR